MSLFSFPARDLIRARWFRSLLLAMAASQGAMALMAAAPLLLLDDYADPRRNRLGQDRIQVDDKALGGSSTATARIEKGVLHVKGALAPGRGVPGFVSQVSLLSEAGRPKDLSGFEGVRLKVRVLQGILAVQVSSTEVTNFDYHASAPIPGTRGAFQEVRIPFKDLKRSWSPQTVLNLKTVTSISLVSYGMSRDAFSYEVDEIGFY